MTSLICRQCSAPFEKVPGKKGPTPRYCSDICRMAARGRKSVATHGINGYKQGCRCEACSAGARDGMRDYFRARGGNPHHKVVPKVACAGGCGKLIRQGTCRDCAYIPIGPRRRYALTKLRNAALGTRSKYGAWVQGRCLDCGEDFTRRKARVVTPFCSDACRRRVERGNRRALEAGCKITPGRRRDVHERDDWTCRLCGFPVNREAVVPDLEAPVIDHIVSLARGGEHAPHNWQTAHFLCNSYKRDLDMADVA